MFRRITNGVTDHRKYTYENRMKTEAAGRMLFVHQRYGDADCNKPYKANEDCSVRNIDLTLPINPQLTTSSNTRPCLKVGLIRDKNPKQEIRSAAGRQSK
jgi:hypothetical protein